MKFNMFTFGLGTGIICMTVLFYIFYSFEYKRIINLTSPSISDDEIIQRAEELGMVSFRELTNKNSNIDLLLTDEEIIERASSLGMDFVNSEEEDSDIDYKQGDMEYIIVTIPNGYTAIEISNILEESGLIEDKELFKEFVVTSGATRALVEGTYEIPMGSDFNEILNIIKIKKNRRS